MYDYRAIRTSRCVRDVCVWLGPSWSFGYPVDGRSKSGGISSKLTAAHGDLYAGEVSKDVPTYALEPEGHKQPVYPPSLLFQQQ